MKFRIQKLPIPQYINNIIIIYHNEFKKGGVTSSFKCNQITLIVRHSLGDTGFTTFFDHLVLHSTGVLKFYRFYSNLFDITIVIRIIYGKN